MLKLRPTHFRTSGGNEACVIFSSYSAFRSIPFSLKSPCSGLDGPGHRLLAESFWDSDHLSLPKSEFDTCNHTRQRCLNSSITLKAWNTESRVHIYWFRFSRVGKGPGICIFDASRVRVSFGNHDLEVLITLQQAGHLGSFISLNIVLIWCIICPTNKESQSNRMSSGQCGTKVWLLFPVCSTSLPFLPQVFTTLGQLRLDGSTTMIFWRMIPLALI